VWERDWYSREAAADPEIEVIERAGVDAHEDFAGTGVGLGDVFVFEDARVTVFVEYDCFHC
jgi:hypothetical protein